MGFAMTGVARRIRRLGWVMALGLLLLPERARADRVTVRVTRTTSGPATREVIVRTLRRRVVTRRVQTTRPVSRPAARLTTTRSIPRVERIRKVRPFSQWVHEDDHVWFGDGADLKVDDDEDKGRAVLKIKNDVRHGRTVKVKLYPGQSIVWADLAGRRFRVTVLGIADHEDRVWLKIAPL